MNKMPCKIGRILFSSFFFVFVLFCVLFLQFISTRSVPRSAWPLGTTAQGQLKGLSVVWQGEMLAGAVGGNYATALPPKSANQ